MPDPKQIGQALDVAIRSLRNQVRNGDALKSFAQEITNNSKPLDPEIQKFVSENFWDLI